MRMSPWRTSASYMGGKSGIPHDVSLMLYSSATSLISWRSVGMNLVHMCRSLCFLSPTQPSLA
uniref:Acetylglucosaminyltransferase/ transferase, transferring glycosyl groups n=1 Tax=Arundo donax TaxID=35708 RepID=A0A0A9DZ99_ARUDO